jgi:hypothetical protein
VALDVLAEALHSANSREWSERGHIDTHLLLGKAHGLSIELPEQELSPCEGLCQWFVNRTSKFI